MPANKLEASFPLALRVMLYCVAALFESEPLEIRFYSKEVIVGLIHSCFTDQTHSDLKLDS